LRIRPQLSLDYAQSDIERIEQRDDGKGYDIETTFFGLYGVASPLPGYYSEELLDEEYEDRDARRGFLDIIHQQLYPLLYQAWLKYRFAHNTVENEDQKYWEILFSLIGLSKPFRQAHDGFGQLLKYAGIINQRPKSQLGLKTILQDYLTPLAVDIEPCVQRRVMIPPHQKSQLGGHNNQLGSDCVLDECVQDRSGKLRIDIGPLDAQQFLQFTCESKAREFIQMVCRLFLAQPLLYDIQLTLQAGAIRPVCLGEQAFARLGQSCWLVDETNTQSVSMVLSE